MGRIFDNLNEGAVEETTEDYLVKVECRDFDDSLSLIECALTFVNEMNEDWNTTMRSMALKELAVLESTGVEMVYEAFDAKSYIDKIVAFFKTLWENVSGLFKSWYTKIDSYVNENKGFIKKYEAAFLSGAKNIPADGFKIKGYDYSGLSKAADNIKAASAAIIDSDLDELLLAADLSKIAKEDYADFIKKNKENDTDFSTKILMLLGAKDGDMKSFNTNLKKFYFGESINKITSIDTAAILKDVKSAYSAKNEVKAIYSTFQKDINSQIKKVEGWKKGLDKADELRTLKMSVINSELVPLRFQKQKTSTAIGVILQAIATKLRQDKEVMKIVSKFAAEDKQVVAAAIDTVKESSTSDFESSVFGLGGLL